MLTVLAWIVMLASGGWSFFIMLGFIAEWMKPQPLMGFFEWNTWKVILISNVPWMVAATYLFGIW
jgi:hypothetical protein